MTASCYLRQCTRMQWPKLPLCSVVSNPCNEPTQLPCNVTNALTTCSHPTALLLQIR